MLSCKPVDELSMSFHNKLLFFHFTIFGKLEAIAAQCRCQKFTKCCQVFSCLGRFFFTPFFSTTTFASSCCETVHLSLALDIQQYHLMIAKTHTYALYHWFQWKSGCKDEEKCSPTNVCWQFVFSTVFWPLKMSWLSIIVKEATQLNT